MARNLGLLASALLLLPASAQAVSVTISNVAHSGSGTVTALELGDTLTFTGVYGNATPDDVFGFAAVVGGYDSDSNWLADNGLAFVSGDVSATAFAEVESGGVSFLGLNNTLTQARGGLFQPLLFADGMSGHRPPARSALPGSRHHRL
jgi:hypothetical protein